MTKRLAFTLAEVLITMTIIGVVAAMTLPTLIQKHQKKVLATKFQQSLSILSQGFQKMMADEGVNDFKDTEWYQNACFILPRTGSKVSAPKGIIDNREICTNLRNKYFNVIKVISRDDIDNLKNSLNNPSNKEKVKYLYYRYKDDENNHLQNIHFTPYGLFMLPNGLIVSMGGNEYIDTNGDAGPNMVGYDVFRVGVEQDGLVVPLFSSRISRKDMEDAVKAMKYDLEHIEDIFSSACGGIEEEGDKKACEDDVRQQIENDIGTGIETYTLIGTREGCKKDHSYCGDYLYRNGFVMDY